MINQPSTSSEHNTVSVSSPKRIRSSCDKKELNQQSISNEEMRIEEKEMKLSFANCSNIQINK